MQRGQGLIQRRLVFQALAGGVKGRNDHQVRGLRGGDALVGASGGEDMPHRQVAASEELHHLGRGRRSGIAQGLQHQRLDLRVQRPAGGRVTLTG